MLAKSMLPHVNLFCYGQVESPYGSGEYIQALSGKFGDNTKTSSSRKSEPRRDLPIHQRLLPWAPGSSG